MEISVGDFGRMIFEQTVGEKCTDPPEHWKSIQAEAEPLVRKLLALNKKMIVDGKPGGYEVHGYVEKGKGKKKKVLSKDQRIKLAQEKVMEVSASTLKEGDRIWLNHDYDIEMYFREHEPVTVDIVKGDTIIVAHPYERHGVYKIHAKDQVLLAPKDWDEKEDEYHKDEYWLAKADELGI